MNSTATTKEFKSTTKEAGDAAKATGSAIGTEVKNFISDLEDIVSSKSSLDLGKIKDEISSKVSHYKSSLETAGQQAIAQARQQVAGVDSYVHHEPWKAIGVGFAMGLLLGVVVSRR